MGEEIEPEVKSFTELGLSEELIDACGALAWTIPTKIQSEVIPHALNGSYFRAYYFNLGFYF